MIRRVNSAAMLEVLLGVRAATGDDVLSEIAENIDRGKKSSITDKVLQEAAEPFSPVTRRGERKVDGAEVSRPQGLPSTEVLPDLRDERLRAFAFRYALETKSRSGWARLFGVTVDTITTWTHRADVRQFIYVVRRKRNLLLAEQSMFLERKAFHKLNEILDLPVTVHTVESLRKTILDVLGLVRTGIPGSAYPKAIMNMQLNSVAQSGESAETASELTLNSQLLQKYTQMPIDALQKELAEMELLESSLDGDYEVVGDEDERE